MAIDDDLFDDDLEDHGDHDDIEDLPDDGIDQELSAAEQLKLENEARRKIEERQERQRLREELDYLQDIDDEEDDSDA